MSLLFYPNILATASPDSTNHAIETLKCSILFGVCSTLPFVPLIRSWGIYTSDTRLINRTSSANLSSRLPIKTLFNFPNLSSSFRGLTPITCAIPFTIVSNLAINFFTSLQLASTTEESRQLHHSISFAAATFVCEFLFQPLRYWIYRSISSPIWKSNTGFFPSLSITGLRRCYSGLLPTWFAVLFNGLAQPLIIKPIAKATNTQEYTNHFSIPATFVFYYLTVVGFRMSAAARLRRVSMRSVMVAQLKNHPFIGGVTAGCIFFGHVMVFGALTSVFGPAVAQLIRFDESK